MPPRKKIPTVAALLVFAATAGHADPRTINDAVYTDQQAEAGEDLYAEHCLTCHDKKYFRPVLKTWDGQALGLLYTVMSTSMPESNPGALSRKDYVDILAYILAQNRYPSGDSELGYEGGMLDEILITGRKGSSE